MEKGGENQKTYELGYFLVSTIPEEKVGEEVSGVISVLESNGHIISSGMPEKKELEYEMSKIIANKKTTFSSGYFGFVIFQTEAEGLTNIKTELEKNDNILRFIIINRSKSSLIVEKKRTPIKPRAMTGSDKKVSSIKPKDVKIDEEELDKTIEELIV